MKNYKQSNLKLRLPFESFWSYPSSFQQLELISLFEELDRKSNAATVLLQVHEKWQASRSSISKSRTNFLNLKGKMERLSIEPQASFEHAKTWNPIVTFIERNGMTIVISKIGTLQLRVNCKMRHNVSPKSWWKHFICRCTFRVRPYQYFYSTFKLKNRETKLTLNNSKTYLKTNPCLASVLKIVFQRSCVTAVVELEFFTSNLGLRKSDLYAGNTVYVSYRGNPRIPRIRYNSRIDTPKDLGKNYNPS